MSSFEINKFAGAFLGALLLVFGLRFVSDFIFHVEAPEKPGFAVAVADAPAPAAEAPAAATAEPIATRLASADVAKGEASFKKCSTCHTVDNGGPNRVGPNLYNVVGGPKAHIDGFAYSGVLADAGKAGQKWGFEELDKFIENPKAYMAGTKMAFAGIKDAKERADLIKFLHGKSDAPVPLP